MGFPYSIPNILSRQIGAPDSSFFGVCWGARPPSAMYPSGQLLSAAKSQIAKSQLLMAECFTPGHLLFFPLSSHLQPWT